MCTKVACNSHSFLSVLDDCCKESEEIHVEEEEEEGESEVGGIENNELLDFCIYKLIVHAVLGC